MVDTKEETRITASIWLSGVWRPSYGVF